MREIKFRGKAIMSIEELNELGIKHKDGWVYGNLIKDDNEVFIVGGIAEVCEEYINPEWWVAVDPETVGQYTGFKDATGKEIYEGDIVHVTDFFHGDAKVYKGVVKFVGGYYQIEGQDIRNAPLGWIISSDDLEVIGNIYENPEYLERGGVR